MAELSCKGLAKSFGETVVLSDVDLVVPQGTLTAILGASGSGKTTLLRLLIGFLAADSGVISIGGSVVADAGRLHVAPDKRAVGYVAQEGALFPHLTVAENIGFGLRRSERRRSSRIDEALDLVGLDRRYATRQPHQLSGGEQRRVALARALAPGPAVVLLDEPFSGLDASLRAETRDGGARSARRGRGDRRARDARPGRGPVHGAGGRRSAAGPARPDRDANRPLPDAGRPRRGAIRRRGGRSARRCTIRRSRVQPRHTGRSRHASRGPRAT